jgi:hypothetical protein
MAGKTPPIRVPGRATARVAQGLTPGQRAVSNEQTRQAAARSDTASRPVRPAASGSSAQARPAASATPRLRQSLQRGGVTPHEGSSAATRRAVRQQNKAGSASRSRGGIKVRATQTGYYNNERQRPGDVFVISDERYPRDHPKQGQVIEFSDRWMEPVNPETPMRTTSPNQSIQKEHDRILQQKYGDGADAGRAADADALGDDDTDLEA